MGKRVGAAALGLLGIGCVYVGSLAVLARVPDPALQGSDLQDFRPSRYILEVHSYSSVILPQQAEFCGVGWIDVFYRPILRHAARDSEWEGNWIVRWILNR